VDIDVFVIDTGVSSVDLNIVENVDFSGTDPSASDSDGHGTHIAGIVGAKDDDYGIVGLAPGARIHNLKVFGPDGSADDSIIILALDHVLAWKRNNPGRPAVVNLSLGVDVGTTEFTLMDDAVQELIDAGVTVVVAAGNEGVDVSMISPAHVPDAITVGSVNERRRFSPFSNFGSGLDLLAPGQDVISTSSNIFGVDLMSGTSMAAAHVSGAAALFLAEYPSGDSEYVSQSLDSRATAAGRRVPKGTTRDFLSVVVQ
jgi:subtilisin family serine protease